MLTPTLSVENLLKIEEIGAALNLQTGDQDQARGRCRSWVLSAGALRLNSV